MSISCFLIFHHIFPVKQVFFWWDLIIRFSKDNYGKIYFQSTQLFTSISWHFIHFSINSFSQERPSFFFSRVLTIQFLFLDITHPTLLSIHGRTCKNKSTLTAQKTNCILSYIKMSVVSSLREVILPSNYVLVRYSLGVLHLDLESSVQQGHRSIGACPEKSHRNHSRDGTPSLPAERAGAVQLGKEKALGSPESGLSSI